MANNEAIPFYDDGDHISGICDAPVTGKTFVKISGTRSGGTFSPAATTAGDGGLPHVATADVGGRVHGVASYDGVVGAVIDVVRGCKMVVPVTAGGPLSAFDEVAVGANGQAVTTGTDTRASVNTGVVANNNAITWTAVDGGEVGNGYQIELVNNGANLPLEVTQDGDITVVQLATDGTGTVTSTAAQVIAAVNAAGSAAATHVTAANDGASTGAGVVVAVAATNLAGGAEAAGGQPVGYVLADCAGGADAQVSLY